jgi:dolichyl-diphosphooligosaccharide--protein glycosyltransferase/undecaprenyl-diphosphooligosaccharide--protein glycosyltransferase
MLNIVLPTFLLWSIIWAVNTNEDKYLLITAIDILIYRWWYPQSYSLEFSFFGLILLYTLLFDRKNLYNYKLLAIMMLAMMGLDTLVRFALVLVAFFAFKRESFQKYVYYILGFAVLMFFVTGGFSPIWGKLNGYIFQDSIKSSSEGLGLHFFSVMQTIREAGKIPFETFANRISGSVVTFVIAMVAYIYLVYRHKIMLLSLPMLGLGFLAYVGGLRFTVYAVPILALAIAFAITELSSKLPSSKLKIASMVIFTLAILYPNYKHIVAYKVPTVFKNSEVQVLAALDEIAKKEDYTVSWWDYGYPIRYYAKTKTLADGGIHSGQVNFPISFILTNPQNVAAKMARLDVEFQEQAYKKSAEGNSTQKTFSNIEEMTKAYGFQDTNEFLKALHSDIKLPKKTRDIYIYLPYKLLDIYPTVKIFSNMDLMTGKKYPRPFFFMSKNYQDNGALLQMGSGVSLNKANMTLNIGKNVVPLKRFVQTSFDKNMQLHKSIQKLNPQAGLSMIYMKNYNTILILDEPTYNSLYIQLFVLENFDPKLFEPKVSSPLAKVYKLKI